MSSFFVQQIPKKEIAVKDSRYVVYCSFFAVRKKNPRNKIPEI